MGKTKKNQDYPDKQTKSQHYKKHKASNFTLLGILFIAFVLFFLSYYCCPYLFDFNKNSNSKRYIAFSKTSLFKGTSFIRFIDHCFDSNNSIHISSNILALSNAADGKIFTKLDNVEQLIYYIIDPVDSININDGYQAENIKIGKYTLADIYKPIYDTIVNNPNSNKSLVIILDKTSKKTFLSSKQIKLLKNKIRLNKINENNLNLFYKKRQLITLISTDFKSDGYSESQTNGGLFGWSIFEMIYSEYDFPDLVALLDSAQQRTNINILKYTDYIKIKNNISDEKKDYINDVVARNKFVSFIEEQNSVEHEIKENRFQIQTISYVDSSGTGDVEPVNDLINRRKNTFSRINKSLQDLIDLKNYAELNSNLIKDYKKDVSDITSQMFIGYKNFPELEINMTKNGKTEIIQRKWEDFYNELSDTTKQHYKLSILHLKSQYDYVTDKATKVFIDCIVY